MFTVIKIFLSELNERKNTSKICEIALKVIKKQKKKNVIKGIKLFIYLLIYSQLFFEIKILRLL